MTSALVAAPRKRLTFTLAHGQGLALRDELGVSTIHVLELHASGLILVVNSTRPAQSQRYHRPAGQGVIVGESLVHVQRIGVRGKRLAVLKVSAPHDVLVSVANDEPNYARGRSARVSGTETKPGGTDAAPPGGFANDRVTR